MTITKKGIIELNKREGCDGCSKYYLTFDRKCTYQSRSETLLPFSPMSCLDKDYYAVEYYYPMDDVYPGPVEEMQRVRRDHIFSLLEDEGYLIIDSWIKIKRGPKF